MPDRPRTSATTLDHLHQLLPHVHEELARLRGTDATSLRAHAEELDPDDAVTGTAIAATACRLVLGVELHDPQLLAGLALAAGLGVQMRTGEGKTFAAIGPALLLAKRHGSVHVVTANPYLAERDAAWSGRVLQALGLRVAATLPGRDRAVTRAAYRADVVFGAGSDFGFDFLRDRLVLPGDDPVQRGRPAAIVDEIDAVLVDAARTPLVLSGSAAVDEAAIGSAEAAVAAVLRRGHATMVDLDQSLGRVELTDRGISAVEEALGLTNLFEATAAADWPFLIHNALRAHVLLRRDRDYVVRETAGTIAVIDELTGRILPGRRWSDGLHQAVEAKEGVAVTRDRRPLGRVTVGSYFSGYDVLVGMSGTLDGAEDELLAVHGLRAVALPTNVPVRRIDHLDLEVGDEAQKLEAVAEDTAARHRHSQPVLVGTVSIAQAQQVSALLVERGVPHQVLTAKNDAAEAAIIAEAGRPGAVTVATQMAGRGVDIVVDHPAGLMVWGVEHHASLRLDLQLRGRSGRQGDKGESRFAVSRDEPMLEVAPTVPDAQRELEELEAAVRSDGRTLDTPIDAAHDALYQWRLQAADHGNAAALLAAAVHRVALSPGPHVLERVNGPALPRTSGRRTREIARRIDEALDARARSLDAPEQWQAVTAAVLQRLLVDLWSDTLDRLDADKNLARISHLFGVNARVWTGLVESRYVRFRTDVIRAWVLHLLAARLASELDGPAPRPASTVPTVPPRPSVGVPEEDVEDGYEHEWSGPSLNKFWRRYMSMAPPDPPLVLELDAIGDVAAGTIQVFLDHDDPERSLVVVPRQERPA